MSVETPSPSSDITPVGNPTQATGVQPVAADNEPISNGTGPPAASTAAGAETNSLDNLLRLISTYLDHVKKAAEDLEEYRNQVSAQITEDSTALERIENLVNRSRESSIEDSIEVDVLEELGELKKRVLKLKLQIPANYKPQSDANKNQRHNDYTHGSRVIANIKQDRVPSLCKNQMFENSSEFKDFKALYDGLNETQKICLLCFSVFPENEIIQKRFMLYWWIAEGFVRPILENETTAEQPANESRKRTAEDLANEVFSQLMAKGFIHKPFNQKRSLEVDSCKMHPFVRAALVMLADKANMFEFDPKGNPTAGFSSSLRACLVARERLKEGQDLDKVHMLINVDENFLEFEKPEFFSMMKNINLLCLGRWQTSPKHHIEVEDNKFLEGLKDMKYLKFLSLQGISRIMQLPGCISNLTNLMILDLRACHNLEEIPDKIGSLRSLTHLDMAECYLLDKMPKDLSSLSELQVLKGFVVGNSDEKNSCTLEDLAKLPKLRKLSIYTGRKDFPSETELKHLHKFQELRKLTIVWGRGSQGKSEKNAEENSTESVSTEQENGNDTTAKATPAEATRATPAPKKKRNIFHRNRALKGDALDDVPPELPKQLEKLDLQCCPLVYAPDWLQASKLKKLKKLYIRGGTLRDVGQIGLEKLEWEVEILRLKFLNEIQMDWVELRELFPNLIYLEKVRCPKLTLFPCDHHGVWMEKTDKLK